MTQYNNGGCFIPIIPVFLLCIFLVKNKIYFLNVTGLILHLLVILLHCGLSCFRDAASQPMQLGHIIYLHSPLIMIFPNTSKMKRFSWTLMPLLKFLQLKIISHNSQYCTIINHIYQKIHFKYAYRWQLCWHIGKGIYMVTFSN